MTKATNISELAQEVLNLFTTAKRDSGEEFLKTADDRPEWVTDMIRDAHDGMWPDDIKYEYIQDALQHIADEDFSDPDCPEIEADVYNSDLLRWLSSHGERAGFVDEAVEEMGHSKQGITGDIMMGQVKEKEQVYFSVLQSLRNRLEELDDEEDTDD